MERLCAELGLHLLFVFCCPHSVLTTLSLHFSLRTPPWDFETGLWQVARSQGAGEGLMLRAFTLGRGLAVFSICLLRRDSLPFWKDLHVFLHTHMGSCPRAEGRLTGVTRPASVPVPFLSL